MVEIEYRVDLVVEHQHVLARDGPARAGGLQAVADFTEKILGQAEAVDWFAPERSPLYRHNRL